MEDTQLIQLAKEYTQKGEYDHALKVLQKISSRFLWSVEDLLFKARLIQVSSGSEEWTLEDVEECLNAALNKDNENLDVLLEVGFFYARVMDNCERGMEYFEKALKLMTNQYREVLTGIGECILEKESEETASKFIDSTFSELEKAIKESLNFDLTNFRSS